MALEFVDTIRKKILGPRSKRLIKKIRPIVAHIATLEPEMKKLSDNELRSLTAKYRQRIANGESLDRLLPEAFATVREAGRRVLGMRHFDVQMLGGTILHRGSIAEMRTGEGKTLVATLPAYLNALEGRGVHVVTVNDYLAKRDAEWMGRIYKFLGMSVGVIVNGMLDLERQDSYRADITYAMNSELGFDYMRDNMKTSIERYVQRELHYAVIDEVDSILVDEARTPLIISGRPEGAKELYYRVNAIMPSLKKDVDYTLDEKQHQVMLTDEGVEKVEQKLGLANLYDPENLEWNHHVTKALQAHTLYKKDVHYTVEGNEIFIIDEFTGRKLIGRRWSEGLHQAVQAKENVHIEEETNILSTVTYQNFFRMYHKLSGMTGTAETEAQEFTEIYKLGTVVVPTNLPMIRDDAHDLVYKNERGKFRAVVNEIIECHEKGQPVLVGTVSVEKSEVVASQLKKKGIKHEVLNAKQHAREALIVAQAGRKGAVTISTNMAGRGTDILLGGNPEGMAHAEADPEKEPEKYAEALARYKAQCAAEKEEVKSAGGLHIIGTERHESRRVDNQLRGRAGRQGDPGSSRFYLSLEDDLLRIFAADRMTGIMEWLGMEEDVPIEHRMVNRAIEGAQKKVEERNFDIRKNLLDYDDVMSQQRLTVYATRRQVLEGRYQRELSEDEKKKGKIPEIPTQSGEMTIEKLAAQIRPQLVQIVDVWQKQQDEGPYRADGREPAEREAGAKNDAAAKPNGQAQKGDPAGEPKGANGEAKADGKATNDAAADGVAASLAEAAAATSSENNKRKAARKLKHEVYKWFGAVIELESVVDDREKILETAANGCAASLIQQRERVLDLFDHIIGTLLDEACPANSHGEEYRLDDLEQAIKEQFGVEVRLKDVGLDRDLIGEAIWKEVEKLIQTKELELSPLGFLYFARHLYLEEIDLQWIDHLKSMDHLRDGVGLVGYGQKDPKLEYKKEGFNMFMAMMARIDANVARNLSRLRRLSKEEQAAENAAKRQARLKSGTMAVKPKGANEVAADAAKAAAQNAGKPGAKPGARVVSTAATATGNGNGSGNGSATAPAAAATGNGNGTPAQPATPATDGGASGAVDLLTSLPEFKHKEHKTVEIGGATASAGSSEPQKKKPVVRDGDKVGRNDLCPCGSGKKYKKCHGEGAVL
jgi:preprotein translocase subunit SecA